jgi:hypothetical protein
MNPRRVVLALSVVVMLAGGAALAAWWSRPPQMGADEQAFAAVDALFTAVTARDDRLLADCEARLHGLHDAGKLPDAAAGHLDRITAKARAGKWEAAAEQLHAFMAAQKRDGPAEPRKKATKKR